MLSSQFNIYNFRGDLKCLTLKKHHCLESEYTFDEAKGNPDRVIAEGTRWEDIHGAWVCPICSAPKGFFKLIDEF